MKVRILRFFPLIIYLMIQQISVAFDHNYLHFLLTCHLVRSKTFFSVYISGVLKNIVIWKIWRLFIVYSLLWLFQSVDTHIKIDFAFEKFFFLLQLKFCLTRRFIIYRFIVTRNRSTRAFRSILIVIWDITLFTVIALLWLVKASS